jgi:hypothetical protein
VAIDTSGRWWRGSQGEDIEAYLAAYTAESYGMKHYRACICACGSTEFSVERDAADQARRKCAGCGTLHYIADAEEDWEPGLAKRYKCIECKSPRCNVGVGYAGYDDDATGIKWIYVGVRCAQCGILGCFAEWKVALSDALDLLNKA